MPEKAASKFPRTRLYGIMAKVMDFLKNRAVRTLRRFERYTHTDMVYLAENGFWLLLKTVLAILIGLGLSVAFANLLPKHTFGEYKFVFSVLGILSLTTLPGLGTSVVRSVAKGFDGTPLAVLKTKIMWGLLGAFASALLALYYYTQGNLGLAGAFAIAAVFLPVVDTFSIFSTVLTGKKLFRISIVYETAVQAVSAACIALTLYLTDSLILVLLSYFASYSVVRLVVLWFVLKRHTTNRDVDQDAVPHGLHLSAMEVFGTIAESLNSILLWMFVGPTHLAVYAFAKAMPVQMSGGLKKLALIALPKFVDRDLASIKRSLPRRLMFLWLILFAVFLAYVLLAPFIFETLFPQYTDAIFYSQLFALSFLFFPKKIFGTIFNAHQKTGALYTNAILTPITQLVLSVALVPTFGILGALTAELTAQFFSLILVAVLLLKTRA